MTGFGHFYFFLCVFISYLSSWTLEQSTHFCRDKNSILQKLPASFTTNSHICLSSSFPILNFNKMTLTAFIIKKTVNISNEKLRFLLMLCSTFLYPNVCTGVTKEYMHDWCTDQILRGISWRRLTIIPPKLVNYCPFRYI